MVANGDAWRAEGNTKTSAQKRSNQLINWFFTYNNYPMEAVETLKAKFDDLCELYVFQAERGENGTDHLQGYIKLKKKMRWEEFKLDKAIHWEKVKSDIKAQNYCMKEDTRVAGPWAKGIRLKKELKLIKPDRIYQKYILDIIQKEPDERKIYWFFEPEGNVGKSSFCKYLIAMHNAIFIDEGKKADLMNHILTASQKQEIDLVVLDVPRDNKNCISYKSIESIKNGMIYSSKYEGGQLLFNSPHVIIFSNYPPDESKLSKDRWEIFEIVDNFDIKKYDSNNIEFIED